MVLEISSEAFAKELARYEARPVTLSREEVRQRRRDLSIGGELNRLQGERPTRLVERLDALFAHGQASVDEVVELVRQAYALGLLEMNGLSPYDR